MTDREALAREIRRRLTPQRLVTALSLGKGAQPQAGGFLVLCPAHEERTPSCSVTLGKDGTTRVRCFGCDFSGDAFSLVAAKFGWNLERDFPRVLHEAGRACGVDVPLEGGGGERRGVGVSRTVRWERGMFSSASASASAAPSRVVSQVEEPFPSQNVEGNDDHQVDAAFAQGASWLLAACPLEGSVGVGLATTGLLEEAVADGWGELPRDVRQQGNGGFDAEELGLTRLLERLREEGPAGGLGWLVREGRVAWPSHRLLIPWRAPDGRVWSLQRRWAPLYGDETPADKRTAKYLFPATRDHAPPAQWAYGVDRQRELEEAEEVWLVEGARDVLAVRALARREGGARRLGALGLPGVQRWRDVAASVLPHLRGRLVRIALDADQAGEGAVATLSRAAWSAGARAVKRSRPGHGCKDWAAQLELELRGAPGGRAA